MHHLPAVCGTKAGYEAGGGGGARSWLHPLELAWGSLSLALLPSPHTALSPHCQLPAANTGSLVPGALSSSLLPPSSPVARPCLCPPLLPYSFLSLAGNQIRHVENLLDLQYLQFLDLSENLIETLKLGRGTWPWLMDCVLCGVLPPLGSKLLVIFAIVLDACLSWGGGVQSRHETPFFLLYR